MDTIPIMPDWVRLLCFLVGFAISYFLEKIPEGAKARIPSQKLGYLFLLVNALLLAWNTAFILRITAITAGASQMDVGNIDALIKLSIFIEAVVYILGGFVVGQIIFAYIKGRRLKQKEAEKDTANLSIDKKGDASNKPTVNVNLNINSGDIAKMKAEHRKTLLEVIDRLQGNKPKEGEQNAKGTETAKTKKGKK